MAEKETHILVVDDEISMRELLDFMLEKEGYAVSTAGSGKEAIALIEKRDFDLLLCDIRLGDMTGIDVLRAAKARNPHTVVIMISAYASAETAVQAMNDGAYDYLPKPFDNTELRQAIARALEMRTLEREKKVVGDDLRKNLHFGLIMGNSPKMLRIYEMIRQVAQTVTNVMVTGESGTGKELIARAIHRESSRADQPFVAVNCGGIPETLLESELFGHKKGSFTGATGDKKGLFETAHRGTLFLDEIGEISIPIQVKLLRAVQTKMIRPVGGNEDVHVDVRIISATNRNLEEEVIAKRFREDLFYRLNVIEIRVPPLRERKEDLKLLAQHFLEKYSKEMGKDISKVSSYAIDLLQKYDFPGNIRELENLFERSVALTNTNILLPDSLALSIHKRKGVENDRGGLIDLSSVSHGISLDDELNKLEKSYIAEALDISGGNKQKATELLGINMRSLRYRLKKLNISTE
ncbi:sigma-54-dependent transcriptional regulator [Desulfococcus sp.]|uniref:sigma-54-dependent transcriptional regulator n=1 Tax=Desulfococcus sp. TaxID=2025834 RepID=UPI0035934D70